MCNINGTGNFPFLTASHAPFQHPLLHVARLLMQVLFTRMFPTDSARTLHSTLFRQVRQSGKYDRFQVSRVSTATLDGIAKNVDKSPFGPGDCRPCRNFAPMAWKSFAFPPTSWTLERPFTPETVRLSEKPRDVSHMCFFNALSLKKKTAGYVQYRRNWQFFGFFCALRMRDSLSRPSSFQIFSRNFVAPHFFPELVLWPTFYGFSPGSFVL